MPRFLPWKKPKAGVQIAGVDYSDDGGGGGGGSYTLPTATASRLGGVKVGSNIDVADDGTISTHAPYTLPTASADTLGGVKVGSGLSIDNGVLSATGGGGGDVTEVAHADGGIGYFRKYSNGLKAVWFASSSSSSNFSIPSGFAPLFDVQTIITCWNTADIRRVTIKAPTEVSPTGNVVFESSTGTGVQGTVFYV